ncbi:cell adhesion molecule Dscam1 [Parasteatoda tepidariorum]|uniref:cell adhesion molecule Dscam1 n=1 Tax=Parasteatoda tepidariorum TaxID=114398 RepID=UPI001C723DDD|nr:Down syndrome cell adhesion molecule-like protein Dscam2 [Parasteatoda tepidariorum]
MRIYRKYLRGLFLAAFFTTGLSIEFNLKAPKFHLEPLNIVEFFNSSGTIIHCGAEGQPTPAIKWVKNDGEVLQDIPGLRRTRHDGSLVFSSFASQNYRADVHASTYRCEASNIIGVIGSRDVHVKAVLLQDFDIHLFDEFILKGNTAILRCPIPSYVNDYVRVRSWERMDGFIITPALINAKYGMLESGDLYVKDTTDHDGSYSFRCHTENRITKEKKVSKNYSKLVITEPHHSQPPRITLKYNRVSVAVGQRATLPCIAQGFPAPSYRWYRSETGLKPLPDHTLPVSQEGGILVFHKVTSTDSGRYVCHVTNVIGEDKADTELIVAEALRVSVSPPELRLEIGKTATFNCSVSGSPHGIVSWKKDMRTINMNPRVSSPNPFLLQIRQIKRQDQGMYQCFVHRDIYSSQASSQLIIGDLKPTIRTAFPEKTVRSGRFVSLTCEATGHPQPTIRWTLDGIWPLSTSAGVQINTYQTLNGDVISSINFTSVDLTDSGIYTCQARNDAGESSYSNRLNVFGPVFIRSIGNMTAISGETFKVNCPFGGYPYESIAWRKDEQALPDSQKQSVFPNGTLLIKEMLSGIDDGVYTCEVRGSAQEIPASRSFRVVIRTKPQVARFLLQDNLHEGMRTAFTCIVLAGDSPMTIQWLKDGFPINERSLEASIIFAEEGYVSTLTIKSLAKKHSGNYTCLATNDISTASFSAELNVKAPPKWILKPSDISAVSGRAAMIDCQADGVPQPHIRWKVASDHAHQNFKTIVSSSHIHILVNGSLNFRGIEKSDSGYYLCEASNGVGSILSTVVRLTVNSAPQILPKFLIMSIKKGEKFTLDCQATGDQPLRFTWKRNNQMIDPSSETRYSLSMKETGLGVKSTLTIDKTERKDSSLFICTAINDYGEDSMNIQVTIQDLPDAPQNLEVHDVSSRSIRLTWDRPFDGNSPITEYTIMWRYADAESTDDPIKVQGKEKTITVRGLKPKTKYYFRVKCSNSIGESQFGAEVAATTLEEPPRLPPIFVTSKATSSKSVNVTWQMSSEETDGSNYDGFYIGYRMSSSSEPFTFTTIEQSRKHLEHFYEVKNLNRNTDYSFIVQAFNQRGAGPPSETISAKTMEYDRPLPPVIKSYYATTNSIKIIWESRSLQHAPTTGLTIYHRTDGAGWQESNVSGDKAVYTLHDLLCGTKYYCFIVASNDAGRGNSSETITTKTTGSAPLAPDKRLLLTINSTTVTVNLNSWHNGGCPIKFYIIQYKVSGQQDWVLVSNNIVPEQQAVSITDLIPGTWYSILMTSKNDAGSTDAEYVFATLTLSGEYPPHPSEVIDSTGKFYRHLSIIIPVLCSVVVLILVFCVVCLVTKRRTPHGRPSTIQDTIDCNVTKHENTPLSGTYDSRDDQPYHSTHYASSRIQNYTKDLNLPPNKSNSQNANTFGSMRSGYTYDIPLSQIKMKTEDCIYATPSVYFSTNHQLVYNGAELRTNREIALYEAPLSRTTLSEEEKFWREDGDGSSSSESDNEDLFLSLPPTKELSLREDARESETECDRLWKSYAIPQCKEVNRWKEGALVSS